MKALRWRILVALLGVALGASALSVLASTSAVQAAKSPSGSTFIYDTDLNTIGTPFDPATVYDSALLAMANIYQTLTYYDSATKTLQPELATSWSSAHGGTVWTFNLRHNVYFHTGHLMTAAVVKSDVQRAVQLNQAASYEWDAVSSIDTPSQYTIVFHCSYAFPLAIASSSAYSAWIYDPDVPGVTNLANWFNAGHDSGTGPYTVSSFTPNKETMVILKAFPGYWGGWSGKHYTQVVYRYTADSSTAALLLDSKQVTFVETLSSQLWKGFKGKKGYQTPQLLSWQNLLLTYNVATGPLSNLDFRKGVSEAINYNGILAALAAGNVRTPGIVPPGLFGYDPKLPEYQLDLTGAKTLIAKSGINPKHVTLSMVAVVGETQEQTAALIIKSDLARLGITVTVRTVDAAGQEALGDSTNPSSRPSIELFWWWPDYADPYSWFTSIFTKQNPPVWNFSGYSNTSLSSQINQVESTLAVSAAKGSQSYEQMQKEIYQEDTTTSLFDLNYQRVLLGGVKGYSDNPAYPNVILAYRLTP